MSLPFSRDAFFGVFARYNEATAPASLVLGFVALVAAMIALRQPRAMRGLLLVTAVLWVWMGLMYHVAFFASINPAAYAFGALFVLEGVAIAWYGWRSATRSTIHGRAAGAALIAFGLLVYPWVGYAAGQRYPALPTFGLPCPTTIFTLGVAIWAGAPWKVLIIPVAWSVIATSAAITLGVVEDFALIPAVIVVLASRFSEQGRTRRLAPTR